jgi:hypothetical protein
MFHVLAARGALSGRVLFCSHYKRTFVWFLGPKAAIACNFPSIGSLLHAIISFFLGILNLNIFGTNDAEKYRVGIV